MKPQDWIKIIKKNIEFREKYSGKDNKIWKEYLQYYKNDFSAFNRFLTYNVIFSIIKILLPRVYYRNPKVVVRPAITNLSMAKEKYIQFAKILEAIDNWLISDVMSNFKKVIKSVCFDAFLYNVGIVKVGYDTQYSGLNIEDIDEEFLNTSFTQFEFKKGRRIEYDTNIKKGMPYVMRISPYNFVVPADCLTLSNCRWLAHKVKRLVEDVKRDVKYNSKVTNKLKGYDDYGEVFIDLWEIHDFKTGEVYVITEGVEDYLYKGTDILQITGLPFEELTFNFDNDSFWGVSDCKILMPQQKEINEARMQALFYRRLGMLKLIVEENAFAEEELEKILSDEPVVFLQCKSNVLTALKELNLTIPIDLQNWIATIMQDIRELIGFSRIQTGEIETSGRRTGYEVAQVLQGAEIRTGERGDIVGDLIANIFKKIHSYIFKFWTTERVIEIIGDDNTPIWTTYRGQELEGDYAISINIENSQLQTSALRKFELMELYKTLMQDPELTPKARQKIRENLLSQYTYGDLSMIETAQPSELPMEQNTDELVNILSGATA